MSAKEKYQQCVRNVREGATKEEKLARLEELYGVVKGFSEQENAEIFGEPDDEINQTAWSEAAANIPETLRPAFNTFGLELQKTPI